MIERRDFVTTRARATEQGISGLAAPFYREGDVTTEFQLWDAKGSQRKAVERIMPTAFDPHFSGDMRRDVYATFNHNDSAVLGRQSAGTLHIRKSDEGLEYDILGSETHEFHDLRLKIDRGDVPGSSFSFVPTSVRWDTENGVDIRSLVSVELHELGPVTNPAYSGSTTASRSVESARMEHQCWQEEMKRLREEELAAYMSGFRHALDLSKHRGELLKLRCLA